MIIQIPQVILLTPHHARDILGIVKRADRVLQGRGSLFLKLLKMRLQGVSVTPENQVGVDVKGHCIPRNPKRGHACLHRIKGLLQAPPYHRKLTDFGHSGSIDFLNPFVRWV